MIRLLCIPASLLACALAIAPCLAAGAWTNWIRPYRWTDLAARNDAVWAGTLEAGLLRYDVTTGAFTPFTREPDGLASNAITAVEFDRSGRLWAGTQGRGTSRLSADGSRWDLINTFDGVPSDTITVLQAQGDTMWIGTVRGIAFWNGREIAGALPDGVNPSPFASNTITGIVPLGDSLWVSTRNGIYVSRVSTGLAVWSDVSAGLATRVVFGLASDGGSIVALAGGDTWQFNFSNGQWGFRGGIGYIGRLADDNHNVLVVSEQGLHRWNGFTWELLDGSVASPICGFDDPECPGLWAATTGTDGRIWIANQSGLAERTGSGLVLRQPNLPVGNNIQNVALDGERLYLTTFDEGIARYDGATWRNWFPSLCPSCDTTFRATQYAFSLLVDRDRRKWVGVWSSAIEEFDDRVDPPVFVHHAPTDIFVSERHTFGWSSAVDSLGGHWIGQDTRSRDDAALVPIGIDYYDRPGNFVTNFSPTTTPSMDMEESQIRALSVAPDSALWVGYAARGIDVFRIPSAGINAGTSLNQLDDVDEADGEDMFGIECRAESTWVMSTRHVVRYNTRSRSKTTDEFDLPSAPAPRGACHPLDVGPDGTVWYGTVSGLTALHPGRIFEEFSVANSPLPSDEVRAVRVDPATGVVWIGTAQGLSRYDPNYVAPPPPPVVTLSARVWPNPARLTGAGLALRLAGNATRYRGTVHGIDGRVLHRFDTADGETFWDGRDSDGRLVEPGLYFVRIEVEGRTRTARVALLR